MASGRIATARYVSFELDLSKYVFALVARENRFPFFRGSKAISRLFTYEGYIAALLLSVIGTGSMTP
jgi:hypothetical protein